MAKCCSDSCYVIRNISPGSQRVFNESNGNTSLDSYSGHRCISSKPFNSTIKASSPSASSGPFCRICHEGDYIEDLVSLCKCSGSVGLVHIRCMERWLSTRGSANDKCEICNFKFETIRSPKSILEWYQSGAHRQAILGDLACFSLISPLSGASSFLCFKGAQQQVQWNNTLEAGCLMALGTFLITIYTVWNVLTFRYHHQDYLLWRSVNQNVHIQQRMSTVARNRTVCNSTRSQCNRNEQPANGSHAAASSHVSQHNRQPPNGILA